MYQVLGFNGVILDGWERGKTEKGVSFYIHHGSEQTQWDHPLLVNTMEQMLDCNTIKYAAYRTASKINILQKFSKLHLVSLPTIICLFDQHGFRLDQNDSYMLPDELESLLTDIFHAAKLDHGCQTDTELLSEISLNVLLNFYDRPRNGGIKVSSAKVALTLLCSARLQEKYKYLFRQFADHNNCIPKKKLLELLGDLAQIPEYLSERPSFGFPLIEAAAESCFKLETQTHHLGVSEKSFLEWLLCEPQTLVWISTLYRLLSAESVIHDAKCGVCKCSPIVGLRYQCLRCFHYDLCQDCFFTGSSNKKHKLYHPLQEYCYKSTSREGTKALVKTIRNKFSKKTTAKSKQRYLPISFSLPFQNDLNGSAMTTEVYRRSVDSAERENSAPTERALPPPPPVLTATAATNTTAADESTLVEKDLSSRTVIHFTENGIGGDAADGKQRRELESIIVNLEEENRHLHLEIDKLHAATVSSSTHQATEGDHRNMMLARQEVLQDHSHQLELQLGRLKSLLRYLQKTPLQSDTQTKRNPPVNGLLRLAHLQQLESTPTALAPRADFNLLSPIGAAAPVDHFPPDHCSSTNPFGREPDRPFDHLSSKARRSLPHTGGTYVAGRADSSFARDPTPSFQRSSARAVLQSREYVANVSGDRSALESRRYGLTSALTFSDDASSLSSLSAPANPSVQYTFNADLSSIKRDLSYRTSVSATRSRFTPSVTSLGSFGREVPCSASASSDGFDRIQAELDAIIHQLESVYPGCSTASQQQFQIRQRPSGDRAKIIQAAGEIENMLLELVDSMGSAQVSRADPEYRPQLASTSSTDVPSQRLTGAT